MTGHLRIRPAVLTGVLLPPHSAVLEVNCIFTASVFANQQSPGSEKNTDPAAMTKGGE